MEIACRKAASERRWYDPPWGIRDSAKDVHLTGQWSTGVVIFKVDMEALPRAALAHFRSLMEHLPSGYLT